MQLIWSAILFLFLVFPLFAGEGKEEGDGFMRLIPYIIALAVYLLAHKAQKKNGSGAKPLDRMPREMGNRPITSSIPKVDYGKYTKKYKPIEPK